MKYLFLENINVEYYIKFHYFSNILSIEQYKLAFVKHPGLSMRSVQNMLVFCIVQCLQDKISRLKYCSIQYYNNYIIFFFGVNSVN